MTTTRLLHLSDLHLRVDDAANVSGKGDTLAELLGELIERRIEIDGCIITGDLAHYGQPGAYKRLYSLLNSCPWPTRVVPGNHDNPPVGKQLLGSKFWPDEDPWLWGIEGGTLVIGLSTACQGHNHGEVDDALLEKLDSKMSERRNSQSIVFACHHPPVDVGHWWMDGQQLLRGRDRLMEVMAKHKVKALLCGHVHICAFQIGPLNIPIISAPSVAHEVVYDDAKLRPLRFRNQRPRALLHTISSDSLRVVELTFGGNSWVVEGGPWDSEVERTSKRLPAPQFSVD